MRHIIRQHLRKAVLVTLKSGETFRGVLFDADGDVLCLRAFVAIDADGRERPADGELLILRPDVAFMQYP